MIVYRELSSLEKGLGFSARALYAASYHRNSHYRRVQIPKGNGEYREVCVPDDFLKAIQRSIVDNLLVHEEIFSFATAYRFGGSTLANARPHVGKPILLKLGIRRFLITLFIRRLKKRPSLPNATPHLFDPAVYVAGCLTARHPHLVCNFKYHYEGF